MLIGLYMLLSSVTLLNAHKHSASPLFLLVSFDGFRWDYLNKHDLPNIKELIKLSSSTPYVINNFVTSTFPNHWSLATGLYEESHGIVNSVMYDPTLDATFSPGKVDSHTVAWFGRAEPVWVTNQRADSDETPRKSITQWPGSDVVFIDDKKLQDKIVNLPYNHSRNFTDLIDIYMQAFTDAHEPANFGALYFDEPDYTAHFFGPDSEEVKKKLKYVDDTVKYLIDQLKSHHLFDKMNVIITSDHGMASSKEDSNIDLGQYVDQTQAQVYGSYPVVNVFLKNAAYKEQVYQRLIKAPHVMVYKREDIPKELNIKDNKRVGDIMVIAEPGYMLMKPNESYKMAGVHGYLNNQTDMYPFFLSFGPGFKQNFVLAEPFHIVDIYPVVCQLLDIPANPNNGSMSRIKDILAQKKDDGEKHKTSKFMLTVYILLTLFVIGSVVVVGVVVYGKKKRLARRMEYTDGYFMISTSETNDLMENDELTAGSRSLF